MEALLGIIGIKRRKTLQEMRTISNSLDQFIQQVYLGETMSNDTSWNNVEEGLVEFTYGGKHSASGLLVTDNGLILTPYHVVQDLNKDYLDRVLNKVKLTNGNSYFIDRVCAVRENEDVALVKAYIPGKGKAMKYKFYNTNKIELKPHSCLDSTVAILRLENGQVVKNFGYLSRKFTSYQTAKGTEHQNHFGINGIGDYGHSGAVVLSKEREIMGLHSCSDQKNSIDAVKIISALEVVHDYKRAIDRKIEKLTS